jgi:VWFA-related protein
MTGARRRWLVPALGMAVLLAAALVPAAEETQPRDVGLMERASTRLAQIDCTVTGPKDAIAGLTSEDFEVRLNDKLISGVIVDDLCVARAVAAPAGAPAPPSVEGTPPEPVPPKPSVATYLFYFDMPHLTQGGRRGAIDAAREMLPKLLAGGNRAMIVSNAATLKTVVPLGSDPKVMDAALVKMIDDQSMFDSYSALEDSRLSDVAVEIQRSVDSATQMAKRYAAEERRRQERDLRRLSMVLGQLAELDPPKAALYFADTMRQNAGEHYLSFFSGSTVQDRNGKPTAAAATIINDGQTGAMPLDRVMNEASSFGIRFYTVEGQGITGPNSFIGSRGSPSTGGGGNGSAANQASAGVSTVRTKDAQTTLGSLAAETGGRAFLNGVSPNRMTSQILDDMTCVYLLSFDPRGFRQDAPLSVSVTVKRPKVKTSVRGRLVIQSDGARLTSRVLSSFASPTAKTIDAPVRVGLIPVDYKDGHFLARIQVAMSGSAVPGATWDLGASVVSQGKVWQDGSGRVQVAQANVPVVYEKDIEFTAGEYDLVAVAHEITTDTLASTEVHGQWPKLETELACLGPIAVSQPIKGGFLRNGVTQTQGALLVLEGEPLRGGTPTAIISLVCRAKDQKKPLQVVRTLVGESETPVGTTELKLGNDRCGQIVDLIPPKMLGPGSYRYRLTVASAGTELARGERTLIVPDPAPAQP